MLPGATVEQQQHDKNQAKNVAARSDNQGQPPSVPSTTQPTNSSSLSVPLSATIKTESTVTDGNSNATMFDSSMEVDTSVTDKKLSASPELLKRSTDDDESVNNSVAVKKPRLDVFSADLVIEYVNKQKKKEMELLLDHVLEYYFLENHQLNMMEFFTWKKKPPLDAVRQYMQLNCDQDVVDLLASKAITESWYGPLKAVPPPTTPSVLPPGIVNDGVSSSSTPASIVTPTALPSAPSRTSSSLMSQQTQKVPPTGETPDTGPVSVRPTQAQVPRNARTSVPTSAKTASPSLLGSTSGAAVYSGRPHQTRQHSISAVYDSSIGSQEQIVERAKQEAHVVQRIAELRKEGLWSLKRLPKCQEPARSKAHWDYLLEEMQWLSTDFAQERKWKKAAAKKCARMIMKYFQDKEAAQKKKENEELARLKKIASTLAKEVRNFWSNVEKVLDYKQQTLLEEKRKKALDMHLNFIVGQTEQYSSWLAEGLQQNASSALSETATEAGTVTSVQDATDVAEHTDGEFEPGKDADESDDEETIAKEEADADEDDHSNEIDDLKRESEMPIEELVNSLPSEVLSRPVLVASNEIKNTVAESQEIGESSNKRKLEDEEEDFTAGSSEDDDEETIEKQEEEEEQTADYATELQELDDDANLTLEQLKAKYEGAFGDEQELEEEIPTRTKSRKVVDDSENETVVDDETEEEEDTIDEDETEEDEVLDTNEDYDSDKNEEIGIESLINPEEDVPMNVSLLTHLNEVNHPLTLHYDLVSVIAVAWLL